MMREPEKLAALKMGASSGETSRPEETTSPNRLAFDRSAAVKFARMIQARSSLARERSAPERFARLKSRLLRSRLSRDFPEKSAGFSRVAAASLSRTCSALRSAARQGDAASISSRQIHLAALFIPYRQTTTGICVSPPPTLHLQAICRVILLKVEMGFSPSEGIQCERGNFTIAIDRNEISEWRSPPRSARLTIPVVVQRAANRRKPNFHITAV